MKKSSPLSTKEPAVKVRVKQARTTRTSSVQTVSKRVSQTKKPVVRRTQRVSPYKKIISGTKRTGKRALKSILLSPTTETVSKVIVGLFLVIGLLYGGYSFASTKFGGDVVISKSEILSRVGRVTTLPNGKPEAIVRVQDPESLKKQNAFYSNVSEGDYIIMYPALAIVYSLKNDRIVSLKKIDTQ